MELHTLCPCNWKAHDSCQTLHLLIPQHMPLSVTLFLTSHACSQARTQQRSCFEAHPIVLNHEQLAIVSCCWGSRDICWVVEEVPLARPCALHLRAFQEVAAYGIVHQIGAIRVAWTDVRLAQVDLRSHVAKLK